MFGLFRKKTNTQTLPDCVWRTRQELFEQLNKTLGNKLNQAHCVLAVAHFDESYARLQSFLDASGLSFSRFDHNALHGRSGLSGQQRLMLAHGSDFGEQYPPVERWDTKKTVYIVSIERYPMAYADQIIADFSAGLPFVVKLEWHLALDDPFMKTFGSDRTLDLITANLSQGECISHKMVTRAIENAQKDLAKKIRGEHRAANAEDWFRLNLG